MPPKLNFKMNLFKKFFYYAKMERSCDENIDLNDCITVFVFNIALNSPKVRTPTLIEYSTLIRES